MIPMKMNLMDVVITQLLDKQQVPIESQTPLDEHFSEPKEGTKKRYSLPLELKAQVVYNKFKENIIAVTGDPGVSDGHLTFRRSYLDIVSKEIITGLFTQGITLKKGDIITSIAGFPVNFKINDVRPSGHLNGKANLIMAYFEINEETNPVMRR